MRERSQFTREQSKKEDAEGRKEAAKQILETRRQNRERKERMSELQEGVELRSKESLQAEKELTELGQKIIDLHNELNELRDGWFSFILKKEEIQKLEEQVNESAALQEATQTIIGLKKKELFEMQAELTGHEEADIEKVQGGDILTKYYQNQREEWENKDVDWESIDENFTEEKLSEMDIDSYADMLRRFPSEMVTHVSRRGVRDHAHSSVHGTGLGEHHDSFDKLLESGQMQSAIGISMEQDTTDEFVAEQLKLDKWSSREEAKEFATTQFRLDNTSAGGQADYAAVHFASEWVADSIYGAERENEVFVAFPSAFIASQYEFGHHSISKPHGEGGETWNDLWVWKKEQEGIPIDAGLTFLPKETLVNPETGSRYKLDAENNPIKDKKVFDKLSEAIRSGKFDELTSGIGDKKREVYKKYDEDSIEYEEELRKIGLEQQRIFVDELGVSEEVARALEETPGLRMFMPNPDSSRETFDSRLEHVMQMAGVLHEKATDTVPAEEFWNSYFAEHPDRKPSKIVFYEGGDPNKALQNWREENGLEARDEDTGINLDDRRAPEAPQTEAGSRFLEVAMQVIDKYFDEKERSKDMAA